MDFFKNQISTWLPVLFALLITLFLYNNHHLTHPQNNLFDLQTALSRGTVDSDLIFIEIDSQSIKRLHSWPWPRHFHAQLLKNLRKSGAKKIFFDIDFSTQSNKHNDAVFAESLKAMAPGQVLLPTFLQYTSTQKDRHLTLIRPLPAFLENTISVAVNLRPDADGIVRKIKLLGNFAGFDMLAAPAILSGDKPVLNEQMSINFRIEPDSFKRISYANVYLGEFDPALFKNKNVIIGATALELSDQVPVPVYQSLPGPVVQAITYQSIKLGKLKKLDQWVIYLSLCVLALLIKLILARFSWRPGLLALLALMVVAFIVSLTLYARSNIIFEITPLLFLLLLGFIFTQLARIDQQTLRLLSQNIAIRKKDAMMASVVENTSEGILTIDKTGNIQSINPSARKIFGLHTGEPHGQSIDSLIPIFAKIDNKVPYLNNSTLQEDTGIHKSGYEFPVEYRTNKLDLPEQNIYTVIIRDISERIEHQRALKYQATHDCLTELYNRSTFVENIREAITAYHEKNQKAALLIIDLDRFKEINDTLGHRVGDDVLKEIGDRLDDFSTHKISIARIGGDEFGVLIRDEKEPQQTESFVKEIITSLSKPFHSGDISLQVGASIGIARLPEHSETEAELMMHADVAMYEAKNNRLDYSVYNPKYNNYTVRNLSISRQLKQAIDEEQFEMYYQPKVDMHTHKVVGFEALIRWHHPTLGIIPPDDFITIAERTGSIKPLTFYTLKKSLQQYKHLQKHGHDVSIAVNLSAMLLQDVDLAQDIAKLMEDYKVGTQWLELEVTESAIMSEPDQALEMLQQIRDLGIHLSIDDFGTGYASLSYLKQLPVHQLKVDRYFVQELNKNKSDQIIVQSTIDLSHSLGLKVVAEGVESEQIYAQLVDFNCDIAQGYWISKPMLPSKILGWMKIWEEKRKVLLAGSA